MSSIAAYNRQFVLVSDDVHFEFWFRWRGIDVLARNGAHPADIKYQRNELRAWAKRCADIPQCRGLRLIPI
jgi:hypothetical protein